MTVLYLKNKNYIDLSSTDNYQEQITLFELF